jgi:hypothetical protein
MQQLSVNIYDQEGIQNTQETLELAKSRAQQLGIDQIVLETTTGQTALACAEAMPEMNTIAAVTMHATDKTIHVSRHGQKVLDKDPETMAKARKAGVKFYTGVHPFRGAVSSALHDKLGGYCPHDVVAEVLMQFFSTGTKVAIECTLMAADGGLLDMSQDVIALGGYRGGADTALVIKPAFSYQMFELKVREIIAFPRERWSSNTGG